MAGFCPKQSWKPQWLGQGEEWKKMGGYDFGEKDQTSMALWEMSGMRDSCCVDLFIGD